MPNILFRNLTDGYAWIRIYKFEAYMARTKLSDRFDHSFLIDPGSYEARDYHGSYQMVVKGKLIDNAALRSGNVTISKPNDKNDQQWRAARVGIVIDIDHRHNAVQLSAG
jgi:hypothetical protein